MKEVFYYERIDVNMKNIYLLHYCDEWKSYRSMKLIMATTDFTKIQEQISVEINNGDMEGHLIDLSSFDIQSINNGLVYGYIQVIEDGEVLQC